MQQITAGETNARLNKYVFLLRHQLRLHYVSLKGVCFPDISQHTKFSLCSLYVAVHARYYFIIAIFFCCWDLGNTSKILHPLSNCISSFLLYVINKAHVTNGAPTDLILVNVCTQEGVAPNLLSVVPCSVQSVNQFSICITLPPSCIHINMGLFN